MDGTIKEAPKNSKKLDQWELDDHLRTLTKAKEIMADPSVHKQVIAHGLKKANAIKEVVSEKPPKGVHKNLAKPT